MVCVRSGGLRFDDGVAVTVPQALVSPPPPPLRRALLFFGDPNSVNRDDKPPPFQLIQRPLAPSDLAGVNRVIEAAVQSWPTTDRLKRLSMGALRYREADLQDFEFLLCYKAHACLGIAAWQPDVSLVFQKTKPFAKREQRQKAVNAVLLHGLFVSAKAQGCGIGGLLLDALTRQARERRFAGIFVRAERFSTSYFEQKGFRPLRDGDHPGLQPANYPHRYLMDFSVGAQKEVEFSGA